MVRDSVHSALECDDILSRILLRLPEKCVFKYILVSKRWLHLICSSFRGCYQNRWGAHSHLFGFFVSNCEYLEGGANKIKRPSSEPAFRLLSTCKEGDDLIYHGTIKQLGYFIDYSHNILLCGRLPMHYHLWNSITKHRHCLPIPRNRYKYVCTAFITKELNGEIVYKVVRANCESKAGDINTISIETFSSLTGTWKQSTLVCSKDFSLSPWTVATVIKGVIHWFGTYNKLAIYDPEFGERHITAIKLPDGKLTYDYDDSILGESSDGLLQYGQGGRLGLETWVLCKEQDDSSSRSTMNTSYKYRWELQYRLRFKEMWRPNPYPGIRFPSQDTQIISFVRQNSIYVFIRFGIEIYRCHLESKILELIPYHRDGTISWDFSKIVPYFQQIWPHVPLCITR